MSVIGTAVDILGNVIDTAVEQSQIRYKLRSLKKARAELDKMYEKTSRIRDAEIIEMVKEGKDKLDNEKNTADESLNNLIYHSGNNAAKQVAEAAKTNQTYSEVMREMTEQAEKEEKEQKRKLEEEYMKAGSDLDEEIMSTKGELYNSTMNIMSDTVKSGIDVAGEIIKKKKKKKKNV